MPINFVPLSWPTPAKKIVRVDEEMAGWLLKMRGGLRQMTEVVTTLSYSSMQQPSALQAQIILMQPLHTSLIAVCQLFPFPRSLGEYDSIHPAYKDLVTDFITFVTALLPQLKRFGPGQGFVPTEAGDSPQEALFWQLWAFLIAGSTAFDDSITGWPSCWAQEEQSTFTPLMLVFHSLLSWLQPLLLSQAWQLAKPPRSYDVQRGLLMILVQPVKCFAAWSSLPVAIFLDYINILPPDLVPLVFSTIYSQGFRCIADPRMLRLLSEAVGNFVLNDKCKHTRGCCPFLRDPVVAKVRKLLKSME